MKIKLLFVLTALHFLSACEEKSFYVANIGNAGSLDGPYYLVSISVSDVLGGGGGFGYGAVNGYPGASADIGRMGVPKHIEGYWSKQNPNARGYVAFYRISADIDSELAEKKFVLSEAITNTTNVIWGLCRLKLKLKIFASITL
ncbi:hypothetical protein A8139_10140 [Marinomonas primoryensis]|uniref:Lipoprotein n=1 Tax=Marinomonas primoryensis TaxID=178399 RepID=A0A2Z4PS88_9GAMM|nr:hypothetical protein A8139_10140 [Marinomonas primoryensis]